MTDTVEGLIAEYTRRYVAQDIDGVTDLCLVPFLAIREGRPIHMAERGAVHEHFRSIIAAYQTAGFASFTAVEIDIHPLGEHAAFATVRWNALDRGGVVARDTRTTYHLLSTGAGWRFLSYTNHF